MYIHGIDLHICIYNSMYRYKHVYTWYRPVYTSLPNPVHMVRIPDALLWGSICFTGLSQAAPTASTAAGGGGTCSSCCPSSAAQVPLAYFRLKFDSFANLLL